MLKRTGQFAAEYMVLVMVVLGVLIGGGVYFKRSVQGRWKAAVDDLGDQYDPAYMDTRITHRLTSQTSTDIRAYPISNRLVRTLRNDVIDSRESQSGYMRVGTRPID